MRWKRACRLAATATILESVFLRPMERVSKGGAGDLALQVLGEGASYA